MFNVKASIYVIHADNASDTSLVAVDTSSASIANVPGANVADISNTNDPSSVAHANVIHANATYAAVNKETYIKDNERDYKGKSDDANGVATKIDCNLIIWKYRLLEQLYLMLITH